MKKYSSARSLKETFAGIQQYLQFHAKKFSLKIFRNDLFKNFNKKFDEKFRELSQNDLLKKSKLEFSNLTGKLSFVVVVSGQFCDATYPTNPDLLLLKFYKERKTFDLTRAIIYHALVTFNIKERVELINTNFTCFKLGHGENGRFVEFTPNQKYHFGNIRLRVYENKCNDLSIFNIFSCYFNFWATNSQKINQNSNLEKVNFDKSVLRSLQKEMSAVSQQFVNSQTSRSLELFSSTSSFNTLNKSANLMKSSSWLNPANDLEDFQKIDPTRYLFTVQLRKKNYGEKLVEESDRTEKERPQGLKKVFRFKKVKNFPPSSNKDKTDGPRYITDEESLDSD